VFSELYGIPPERGIQKQGGLTLRRRRVRVSIMLKLQSDQFHRY